MTRAPSVLSCLIALAFGCGVREAGPTTFECTPSCPAGQRCTENGCEPESAGSDMAVAPVAGDLASACDPPCTGAAPFCSPSGLCVSCLADGDCPIGQRCREVGRSTTCVPGCSESARCGGGTKACCGGLCVDTGDDALNCGACGMACAGDHASPRCEAGACRSGACHAGWADCNEDPADGCEVKLDNDPEHCNGCGRRCSIANAVAGCAGVTGDSPAGCYLKACRFGYDDCNGNSDDGCETSVAADTRNCGSCGNVCSNAPNARVACVNAVCALNGCNPGFADCDQNQKNGCEVVVANDKNNCGGCGLPCGQGQVCVNGACTCQQCNVANAKTKCVNNMCVFDVCVAGWGDCNNNLADGCELNTTLDRVNCGQCGVVCPMNQFCNNGVCGHNPCPNPMWLASDRNWTQNNNQYASEILNNSYNATNLLDNDVTTRWVTQSTTNQWVIFNFSRIVTLSGIKIYNQANHTANAGGKDTIVEVGDGLGGPWNKVTNFTVANQQHSFQEFPFPQTQSQYWRVFVLNNWGYQSYIQFMEVGFLGCNQ